MTFMQAAETLGSNPLVGWGALAGGVGAMARLATPLIKFLIETSKNGRGGSNGNGNGNGGDREVRSALERVEERLADLQGLPAALHTLGETIKEHGRKMDKVNDRLIVVLERTGGADGT